MSKAIRVSDITYNVIRQLAYEKRMSQGDVVTEALWLYAAPADLQHAIDDAFTAEVLATQEGDRPC